MQENFKIPSWSARNPLGIIALFISMIYGMSALLLGTSVDSLEDHNETILVAFVVAFPFVVLSVFAWLVASHHNKLYGPGDYQTDQGFLDALVANQSTSLGERLEREIQEEEDLREDEVAAEEDTTTVPLENEAIEQASVEDGKLDKKSKGKEKLDRKSTKQTVVEEFVVPQERSFYTRSGEANAVQGKNVAEVEAQLLGLTKAALRGKKARRREMDRLYMAENLVFQELQEELDGSVRRNVVIQTPTGRRLQADGLVYHDKGTSIVETKVVKSGKLAAEAVRQGMRQLKEIGSALNGPVDVIVAVVVDGDEKEVAEANVYLQRLATNIGGALSVKVISYNELLRKFGFPSDEELRILYA